MSRVRIAVVGMGIGRANGNAFARNPRSVVAALCDLAEDRMQEYAAQLPERPKLYTDYREMCQDPNIDAVFVGTPNQLHVPVALEAVRNGKHVMVTKPLADSVEAARTLVAELEKTDLVGMMSLSTRFGPNAQYLREQVVSGIFGELYYARGRSVRRNGIPNWNAGFLRKGGGAFRDMGVHVLDACWWLMGRPVPISASGVAGAKFGPYGRGYWDNKTPAPEMVAQYQSDDYAGGFIRFANGVGLQIESFWASNQPEEFQIELFGTEAGAKYDPPTLYRHNNGEPYDVRAYTKSGETAWDNLAEHFVSCILDGTPCDAPISDGLRVQEMMEALLISGEQGREVRINEL
jgi:Predicted dehydrogenases and related proteins